MRQAQIAVTLGVVACVALLWILTSPDPAPIGRETEAVTPAALESSPPAPDLAHSTADPALERRAVTEFVVFVRDPAGMPVTGAKAMLSVQQRIEATTSADGRVAFPAADEPAELRIDAAGYLPVVQQVDRCTGTHSVTLGVGEILDGVVEVDGRPPAEPIEITLYTDGRPDKHAIVTGERGSFSIQGLARDWSGRLELPWLYWVVDPPESERAYRLSSPQRGLLVRLTKLPCLRARLLRASDGTALAGAHGLLFVKFDNGLQSPWIGCRADAEGRICAPLAPSTESARIDWLDPAKRATVVAASLSIGGPDLRDAKLELRRDQIPPDLDLGDLRIDTGVELWVRVQDRTGAPIADALLAADGEHAKATDAAGSTRVFAASRAPALYAAAVGYRFGTVTPLRGTGSRDDPLVVELAPGNVLVVRARDPQGGPLACDVQIEGTGWVGGEEFAWIGRFVRFKRSLAHPNTGFSLTVGTDASGEARLPGLAPDVEVTLRILDAFESVLVEQKAVTPPESGTRVVELTVPDRAVKVGGVVLDSLGRPAKGANVLLRHAGSGRSTRTGEDGRFHFEGLHAIGQKLEFLVQYAGHADALRAADPLEGDLELRFELQRAYTIQVSIVDALGGPVDGGLKVSGTASKPHSTRIGRGVHRVLNVPAGSHEFTAEVGNRAFIRRHDPSAGDLRIEVPPAGEVDVDVDATRVGERRQLTVLLVQEGREVHRIHARPTGSAYRSPPTSVLAGSYAVVLKSGDEELGRREIQVIAGQKATIH